MIDTIELFLSACRDGKYNSEYGFGIPNREVDPDLLKKLLHLGILYTYGGNLTINPMGVRVLDRMHAQGKTLTEATFREEIAESKDLYLLEHQDEVMERLF